MRSRFVVTENWKDRNDWQYWSMSDREIPSAVNTNALCPRSKSFWSSPLPHSSSFPSLAHSFPSLHSHWVFLLSSHLSYLFLCSDTFHLPAFINTHPPLISSSSSSGHFTLLPVLLPNLWIPSVFSFFTLMGCVRNYLRPSYPSPIPRAFLSLSAACEGLCTFSSPAICK